VCTVFAAMSPNFKFQILLVGGGYVIGHIQKV